MERFTGRPVLTKPDFVRRYQASEFGNRAPTWDTLEEFLASGYSGLVHIRNRVAGGPTWYNVKAEDAENRWRLLTGTFVDSHSLYISAMAPTERTTIQGEVRLSERHIDLRYSTVKKPMRDALAEENLHASGMTAIGLLKKYMNAVSYDWLMELLAAYPDHVVEFSCYETEWGTIPGYNTVYWECRMY